MSKDIHEFIAKLRRGEVEERDIDLDKEIVLDSKGKRITEKRAQEIARGVLSRAGRGRPSLSGSRQQSPEVHFRVSAETERRLQRVAARQGKSRSQVGREALEEYLSRQGAGQ